MSTHEDRRQDRIETARELLYGPAFLEPHYPDTTDTEDEQEQS